MIKTENLTILMNSDLVEDIILSFLYQNNLIKDKERAIAIDLGLNVSENGMVEVDIIYEEDIVEDQLEITFEG